MNRKLIHSEQKDASMPALEIGLVLAAIKPIAEDIYASGKAKLVELFKTTSADRVIKQLSARAKDVCEVKTLLCLEHPVFLTDFYSPQYILNPNGERIELTTPDVFGQEKRMIIAGVAGQGKSILFRYLVLHELARRNLPLYVELRNYEHADSLEELLLSELSALGLPNDESVMHYLFGTGKCVLYLDAFDEVPPGKESRARKQIEDFARKYSELRVFVSCRPSLEIEGSPLFRVSRLDSLKPDEAKNALFRMCDTTDNIEKIKQELGNANSRITELLTTPLMVTLLLLHFRLSGEFPETEQAFFGDLFDVLLRRHDQTKGYTRKKHSGASELELQHLFGFMSFASRKLGLVEMQRENLVRICDDGIKFYGKSYPPDGALDDIVKGTNLILEEGANCRYAHKAIQEFYAAKFLTSQSEDNVQKFLGNRIKSWGQWSQLLEFAELISPYLFYRYFLIPHVSWIAFGHEGKRIESGWKPSKKVFERVFGDDRICVRENVLMFYVSAHMSKFYLLRQESSLKEILAAVLSIDWTTINLAPSARSADSKQGDDIDGEVLTTMNFLFSSQYGEMLRSAYEPLLRKAIGRIEKSYFFVDYRQAQGDLFT
jgi:hypothetical protein